MRKQMFEVLPSADALPGLYEILRYENASQRAQIGRLAREVERLNALVGTLEERLDTQQAVLDVANAQLSASARATR